VTVWLREHSISRIVVLAVSNRTLVSTSRDLARATSLCRVGGAAATSSANGDCNLGKIVEQPMAIIRIHNLPGPCRPTAAPVSLFGPRTEVVHVD
jgi:hypothetical protein